MDAAPARRDPTRWLARRWIVQRWIVWAAMLAGLAVYALLSVVWVVRPSPDARALAATLAPMFAWLAMGLAGAAVAVRRVLLLRPIARGELDPSAPPGAARATLVCAVTWALGETIALLGLVLHLLGADADPVRSFLAAGAGLVALMTPRLPGRAPCAAELARADVRIG